MSQREEVIIALRNAGEKGVENHDLIYRMGITRAPAIIFELRAQGWTIDTVDGEPVSGGRIGLCTYILRAEGGAAPEPPGARRAEAVRLTRERAEEDVRARFEAMPAAPLTLPCGCVRSADGRRWEERCQKHAA